MRSIAYFELGMYFLFFIFGKSPINNQINATM
jgi:hypothetical protein